ncbi:WecB/TagA/CpsF family glycosyltransferase [bacterium]|nr:WecB/TagA/CpsF family glycosyltransferase [bacterium]
MTAGWTFLSLNFSALDLDEVVDAVATRAKDRAPFTYVATPNVDHCVRLAREPHLLRLYRDAWIVTCDSRVLQLLARIDGVALPVAAGSDVVERLIRTRIDPLEPIALVGGTAETVRGLRARYALADIRWHDAAPGLRDDPDARARAVRFVIETPCRYVFLAVGSPQQEMIAAEIQASGAGVGVGLCCGAALQFLSGEQKRAPAWMRTARLEWLHRLAQDPKRLWRRYLVEGPKVFRLWLDWRRSRASHDVRGGP